MTSPICNRPQLSVPVLSNAIVSIDARRSSAIEPLMTTPERASQAIAAMTALGVARTSGQGQATTSTPRAGIQPALQVPDLIRHPPSVAPASSSTTGKK